MVSDGPVVGGTFAIVPQLAGTGEPGGTIVVSCTDGTTAGSTVVGADGTWSITPTRTCAGEPATDPVELTIVQRLADHADSSPVTVGPFHYVLPTVADPVAGSVVVDGGELAVTVAGDQPYPVRVRVDGATVGQVAPGSVRAEVRPGSRTTSVSGSVRVPGLSLGTHTITVAYVDAAGGRQGPERISDVALRAPDAPVLVTADPGGTNRYLPQLSGTGEPGAVVSLSDDEGSPAGTATVAPDGTWSLTAGDGGRTHDVSYTATQRLGTGATSLSSDRTPAYDFLVPRLLSPDGTTTVTPGAVSVQFTGDAGQWVRAYFGAVPLDPSNPEHRRSAHELEANPLTRSLGTLGAGAYEFGLRYVETTQTTPSGADTRYGVLVKVRFTVGP
ncbi:Ig-like domain-containing protein [Cellulomonas composti]|uniref:Ig-like domain-containing protein n=1 Tax=Cellulomonas composti TaxID=266130 RepID=UPI0035313E9C